MRSVYTSKMCRVLLRIIFTLYGDYAIYGVVRKDGYLTVIKA